MSDTLMPHTAHNLYKCTPLFQTQFTASNESLKERGKEDSCTDMWSRIRRETNLTYGGGCSAQTRQLMGTAKRSPNQVCSVPEQDFCQ